jgi:hypothetical protein
MKRLYTQSIDVPVIAMGKDSVGEGIMPVCAWNKVAQLP